MKKLKLFPKTFLYTAVLMLTITLIAHALLYFLIPLVYTEQKRQVFVDNCQRLAERLKTASKEQTFEIVRQECLRLGYGASLEYDGKYYSFAMISMNGIPGKSKGLNSNVIVTDAFPEDALSSSLNDKNPIADKAAQMRHDYMESNSSFLEWGHKIRSFNGTEGYIQLQETLQPVSEAKSAVLSILPATLLICLAVSLAFAYVYSRKIARPIQEMSKVTERMKKLDKACSCEIVTGDEIGVLAANINSLYQNLLTSIHKLEAEIDHVSEVEGSKADFMRAASHELKTPVTALSAILENMMLGVGKYKNVEAYLPRCKQMTDRLSSMLRDILDASKASSPEDMEAVWTADVGGLIREAAEPFIPIARTRGVILRIHIHDAVQYELTVSGFRKAFVNILSNAVNYADNGKNVTVTLEDGRLTVFNECTPIPRDQIGRLFEPFYRPDYSRNRNTGGNGLGLYITDRLLKECRLAYSFDPAHNGMRFTIWLLQTASLHQAQ